MTSIRELIKQTEEWLAGDRQFDAMHQTLQEVVDELIEEEQEEDEVAKGDLTSSEVHVDGVNWKTPQKKKKKGAAYEDSMDLIHKANEEQKFTLGPWYIPNRADAHNEWSDADELQKALWEYVRSGDRDIRLQHNTDIVAGEWVEAMSFPVPVTLNMKKASGDAKEVTYPSGTVFLGVKWNDWAWDMVKENKITGFSIGGSAARVEMGIPVDSEDMLAKNRFSTRYVAEQYVKSAKTVEKPVVNFKDELKKAVKTLIEGESPVFAEPEEIVQKAIMIDGVKYAIVPLSKSFNDKVFNVAGLYGDDGSVAVVRTDGERFWASGSQRLEKLAFNVAQYAFAEVAKRAKQSFGGNRSAAGAYAANVRWAKWSQDPKNIRDKAKVGITAAGKGPFGAATTDAGKEQELLFASLQSHCDFDAMAASMSPAEKAKGEPEYATLRKHLSPERAALHDKIIDSHFVNEDGTAKTPPTGQPEYVFMGGGPAAGKSSMLAEGAGPEWAGNGTNRSETGSDGAFRSRGTDKHSVAINADEIKADLPPYKQLVGDAKSKGGVGVGGRTGQLTAAASVHEESSILSKGVNARAIQGGFNVILDGTGDKSGKDMQGKIEAVRGSKDSTGKAHGYKVTGVYATVPTEVALSRAALRGLPVGKKYPKSGEDANNPATWTGKGQGRYVHESIVAGTHAGVSRVFPDVTRSFDSLTLFDTSGTPPRQIFSGGKGKRIVVSDQKAYDEFLAKG